MKLPTPICRNDLVGLEVSHSSRSGLAKDGKPVGHLRKDRWFYEIGGRPYQVSRLVWALHNGKDPGRLEVDHIDRNPSNNHPSNLRLSDRAQQNKNRAGWSASGWKYVSWSKAKRRWQGQFKVEGRMFFVGYGADPYALHLKVLVARLEQLPF